MNKDLAKDIADNMHLLTANELQEVLRLVEEHGKVESVEKARNGFLDYAKHMWPIFIAGSHHKTFARAFERVINGDLRRVIINLPPRHTKSEFASWLLPSYFLGKHPTKKLIQLSNTAELAVSFGRKVRNTIHSKEYQQVFPGVDLSIDSKSAGRWTTNKGGEYYAAGVGGTISGRGADLLIIDDPHSEQEAFAATSAAFDSVYEWYTSGPRQRLQPGAAICIVMTRWHKRDLTGRILKDSIEKSGDEWELIELPAILPSGSPLWPEFWSIEELTKLRDELPAQKWAAQYMQTPHSEEGALVKRAWWKRWEGRPPKINFLIMSIDPAHTKDSINDPSALTFWGTFENENADTGESATSAIILDAVEQWLEFPDLKEFAYQRYKEWNPDMVLIEAKASGLPLIQEFRRMGIPVSESVPTRGNDKISRVNQVSDMFSSGMVWAPKDMHWADKVIEQFAEFPRGEHDDLVDSSVQALRKMRTGGWVGLPSDSKPEPVKRRFRRGAYY